MQIIINEEICEKIELTIILSSICEILYKAKENFLYFNSHF